MPYICCIFWHTRFGPILLLYFWHPIWSHTFAVTCGTLNRVKKSYFFISRSLHKSTQQPTLACLCLSLIILLTVFIAGVEHTENRVVCQIVAALLHYSILSVALWMGVEGYQMYLAFIKVLATYHERFMLKCCAVAWGIPAVVVIVTVATASDYYGNEQ